MTDFSNYPQSQPSLCSLILDSSRWMVSPMFMYACPHELGTRYTTMDCFSNGSGALYHVKLRANGSYLPEGHSNVEGIANSYFLTYTHNIRDGDGDLGLPILSFSIVALCGGCCSTDETFRALFGIQNLVQLLPLFTQFPVIQSDLFSSVEKAPDKPSFHVSWVV